MAATLFYADSVPPVGEIAVVDGDEGFHAATVRRIKPGELLVISDGAGALADCVVESAEKRSLTARVTARRTAVRPAPPVTVAQAIPKSERAELAVELATEAGADGFLAWQADRWGNLTHRESARNFNPVMAMAATLTIAQTKHVVPLGDIPPANVHTPGVFVHRVLHVPA